MRLRSPERPRTSAFLVEIAAAQLGRPRTVRLCLEGLVEALVEVAADLVLAHDRRAVLEHDGRDALGAGFSPEHVARLASYRHLPDDVVDAELGQTLANPVREGTPFGLVQLEHHALTSR
jgi:hypothetical protein